MRPRDAATRAPASSAATGPAGGAADPEALLSVRNLSVAFGGTRVVDGVSFALAPGECLALVGESGSGKSVTARTLIGLTGRHRAAERTTVTADALRLADRDLLLPAGDRRWRGIRGSQVGLVLQDALVSLDPLRTVGREIEDSLRLHTRLRGRERAARVRGLLASVGLDASVAGRRPDQLSGGMRQRALIASAIALDPPLLIADEPTTALDATIQAQVLGLLADLRRRGSAMLLISHDLSVVGSVADRIAVMRDGRIVEQGTARQVLTAPRHDYTRMLLRAVPSGKPRGTRLTIPGDGAGATAVAETTGAGPAPSAPAPSVEAVSLRKTFVGADGAPFDAVSDVSFTLMPGRTLGLVGESGSGKSTTARLVLGLAAPDAGEVRLFGGPWSSLPESARRPARPRLGAVYQDALGSFDPRLTVGALLVDALSAGKTSRARAHPEGVHRLLGLVGLEPALAGRQPRTLSGGQRQRVAIARALAPGPSVLVCDEPVSALDVSVQAQILDLLDDLQGRLGLSYLFISHDLAVIRHVSDDVAVMRAGRIVEHGATERVFSAPRHAYTRRLLAAGFPSPA
ncbi:dipeptide ABC transporter ATP-binding protein [Arthrobacter halodurans]|uniref:Dipeptide ABC transporter ATP-binding protein n=1 Tax=Arthrobacter halodurans TaxID=516699 RepID=A0ABV4UQG1_9MICC